MEKAGVAKWSLEGEDKANTTRYKLTLLQEHKITYLAENKRQSPKLLDTNRRRQFLAVALAFDLVAATFKWAPWTSTLPSAFYPEHTFIQKTPNPLKPNEKTFSNRYKLPHSRYSQLSSVKLAPRAAAQFRTPQFTTPAPGRAGFRSRRKDRGAQGALAPEATISICHKGSCALATTGQEFFTRNQS